MKNFYIKLLTTLLVFSGVFLEGKAQSTKILQKYESLERVEAASYTPNAEQFVLRMDYGKYKILNPAVLDSLKEKKITDVSLLYTDHPKGRSFKTLNTNRLITLDKVLPSLFDESGIHWEIVKQTDCPSREVAESYYHGFVFTCQPEPKNEIVENSEPAKPTIQPQKEITSLPPKTPDSRENPTSEIEKVISEYNPVRETFKKIPKRDWKYLSEYWDSVTVNVFNRNHDKWGEKIVSVSDWTASMYPYTTQILRWHLKNKKNSKIRHFVFFNDGDKKRNNEKKKGKIGGIYSVEAESVPQVVNMMKLVQLRGDGGDLEENDIEALIWAEENHPDADEITLIADNKSEVRDMSLAGKLKKPVHIILGRLPEEDFIYINLQYIDLALKTEGSVHTFTHDFYTRKELNELKRRVKGLRNNDSRWRD